MERIGGDEMSGVLPGVVGSDELRASHADRDDVVEVLRVAAGDGCLTMEELDERVEAALTARTLGELAALTADLPPAAGEVEAKDVARICQQSASVLRADGWVVPRRLEIESAWGDVTLDFTRAVIGHRTLVIDLDMQGGALTLITRPGVVVDTDELELGYATVKARPAGERGTPVDLQVRISGRLSFGRVVIRPARRGFLRRSKAT
jgi:Domain of unknown function (DUF1707)